MEEMGEVLLRSVGVREKMIGVGGRERYPRDALVPWKAPRVLEDEGVAINCLYVV